MSLSNSPAWQQFIAATRTASRDGQTLRLINAPGLRLDLSAQAQSPELLAALRGQTPVRRLEPRGVLAESDRTLYELLDYYRGRGIPDVRDLLCAPWLELRDRLRQESIPGVSLERLSMGMSGDFELAIEEGSTEVRIGTAVFGARAYPDPQ